MSTKEQKMRVVNDIVELYTDIMHNADNGLVYHQGYDLNGVIEIDEVVRTMLYKIGLALGSDTLVDLYKYYSDGETYIALPKGV